MLKDFGTFCYTKHIIFVSETKNYFHDIVLLTQAYNTLASNFFREAFYYQYLQNCVSLV